MKKFYQFLGCFVLSLLFMQNLFAGDFTPESNTKYCLQTKGADLVICPDAKLNATLQPFLKSNKDNYELTFEPVDGGGYHIRNTNNQYLYYSGYTMTFTQGYIASKESNGSKGYLFDFEKDEANGGYRICAMMNNNKYVAPDNVAEGKKLYSDKSKTNSFGVFLIVKSDDVKYAANVIFDTNALQLEHGNAASATLNFTPRNFSGNVNISVGSNFKLSETSLDVVDGTTYSVNVSSDKEVGTSDVVNFTYDGNVIASLPIEIIKPLPRYYIVNVETGLTIGGETSAVLCKVAADSSQYFKKVPVNGSQDKFYLVQVSSGKYFKKVDSGDGVFTFYTEFGTQNNAVWQFPANGKYVSLKNTSADRVLEPVKLVEGSKLYLYGLNSDKGTKWELIDTSNLEEGNPWVDVTDSAVIVEKNGLTFTTKVRALNIGDKDVTIVPSENVSVSLTSITNGFDYSNLTISTSADPGTKCNVKFMMGETVLKVINFTVSNKFNRYIICAVQPKSSETTTLAIGNDDDSTKPVLKELDNKNTSEHYLIIPLEGMKCYIVQDGTFKYFAKSEANNWETTLDESSQKIWTINSLSNPDSVIIKNVFNNKSIGVDSYTIDKQIATDRADCYWNLVPLGEITVDKDNILLPSKDDVSEIVVKGVNLSDSITIVSSEGFKVDKNILPSEGGKIVISSDNGKQLTGTIILSSGVYSLTVNIRIKNSTFTVSADTLLLKGKNSNNSFTVSGTDWNSKIILTSSDGFSLDVTSIDPAVSINRQIMVKFTGKKSVDGLITLKSENIEKKIVVCGVLNPNIAVSDSVPAFDETGSAYFTVNAQDLFDSISISSSSKNVDVTPAQLSADAADEYVFLQYKDGVPQYNDTITLRSGDQMRTVIVKGKDGNGTTTGINMMNGMSIQFSVASNVLYIKNVPEESKIVISDASGRVMVSDKNQYQLNKKGVYVVCVYKSGVLLKMAKIINK